MVCLALLDLAESLLLPLALGGFLFLLAFLSLLHFLLLLGPLLLQSTLLEPLLAASLNSRQASIFEPFLTLDLNLTIESLFLGQISGTAVIFQRLAELIRIRLHKGQTRLGLA